MRPEMEDKKPTFQRHEKNSVPVLIVYTIRTSTIESVLCYVTNSSVSGAEIC